MYGLSLIPTYPPFTITEPGFNSLGWGEIPKAKEDCSPFTWPKRVHQSIHITHGKTAIAIIERGFENGDVSDCKSPAIIFHNCVEELIIIIVTNVDQAPQVSSICILSAKNAKCMTCFCCGFCQWK